MQSRPATPPATTTPPAGTARRADISFRHRIRFDAAPDDTAVLLRTTVFRPASVLRATIVAMLVAGVTVVVGGSAAADGPAWQPCPENAAAECATVPVPVDPGQPGGETIGMAVARVRARGDRIGTLIELPGGPGTSGVDTLLHGDRFSPELHERFDIVGFDPRGVGRSSPLRCDAGLTRWPDLVPDAGGSIAQIHSYARQLADSCRRFTGPVADHLDSATVAGDVDALRKALGEPRISLYGRSYGTMIGQSYAERFGDRVRALILDSVDDHSLDGAAFLASEARAGRDTFAGFVSWCDRTPACALHGTNVPARYTDLFRRAERGTLRDPAAPDRPLDALGLSQAVTARLYQPDWAALGTDLRALADSPDSPEPLVAPPLPTGVPASSPAYITCSDWRFDIPGQSTWERLWREQNQDAGALRAHFAWAAASVCSGWPVPPANPPHRPHLTGTPPILVLNGIHDPATPYEWATAVTAHTPGATLLTYDGWGHGIYGRTACTTTAGDRYLIDLTVPPAGTRCPAA
ncbi:alpha/beta hydrolase [Nocardia sp. alder85J]|uniref:alpha/beta hydrolase n=1 Tax=Nocardia sp. alder85J TaxID=2862949 RepID=UPI001CD7C8B7|nr:alpha/beta hydrolase [Nocardia sp. alder85J]MCX4094373.1 alpha/beta hydrolase [Nocardia sp. alder85J]